MPLDDDQAAPSRPSNGNGTRNGTRNRVEAPAAAGARAGLWFSAAVVVVLAVLVLGLTWGRGGGHASALRVNADAGAAVVYASGVSTTATADVVAPSASSPGARVDASPFANERDYWDELERLSVADPPRALQMALAGERWYSAEGRPAEARRAMIVSLLVDTGNMSEARAWTRRFIEQYPQSSYRQLVQGKTGIHPRPGRDGRIP